MVFSARASGDCSRKSRLKPMDLLKFLAIGRRSLSAFADVRVWRRENGCQAGRLAGFMTNQSGFLSRQGAAASLRNGTSRFFQWRLAPDQVLGDRLCSKKCDK